MDTALLAILACPRCRASLELVEDADASGLACAPCDCIYPIRDGIPVLLIEEAIPRPDWDSGAREKSSTTE